MLSMVNNSERQTGGDGKKTSGEIGLSGSMTRQVSFRTFCSLLHPGPFLRRDDCLAWWQYVCLAVACGPRTVFKQFVPSNPQPDKRPPDFQILRSLPSGFVLAPSMVLTCLAVIFALLLSVGKSVATELTSD